MRRGAVILLVGLVGALVAYSAVYLYTTSRQRELMEQPAPELAWLKTEFKLSDAELKQITQLHEGYLPKCEEMCRRIGQKNAEIKKLIDAGAEAAALEQKLAEAAQLRLQCQTNMLHHFMAVARQMPEEQGRRYLAWIQERTLFDSGGMMASHGNSTPSTPEQKPAHHH